MRINLLVRGMLLGTYLRRMPRFLNEYRQIRQQAARSQADFPFGKSYPCLTDRSQESGTLAEHYFYQDLHVARKVFANNPARHVDIGSRIDGFVGHVASFREIEVLDVREHPPAIPGIRFTRADLTAQDFPLTDYCDSLSCLHALEHFGLGRYGDPVDYNGHRVGWENMTKMLKKGGKFYLSVPIGPQRIEFNAHRVFSLPYLLAMMESRYVIDSFAYIDDAQTFVEGACLDSASVRDSFGCRYGCGIFELTKR